VDDDDDDDDDGHLNNRAKLKTRHVVQNYQVKLDSEVSAACLAAVCLRQLLSEW